MTVSLKFSLIKMFFLLMVIFVNHSSAGNYDICHLTLDVYRGSTVKINYIIFVSRSTFFVFIDNIMIQYFKNIEKINIFRFLCCSVFSFQMTNRRQVGHDTKTKHFNIKLLFNIIEFIKNKFKKNLSQICTKK